jgi:ribosomal protein L32
MRKSHDTLNAAPFRGCGTEGITVIPQTQKRKDIITMTIEQITIEQLEALRESGKLRISHTASKQGYISRKSAGEVREYKGHHGKGYTLDTPRWDTTRFFNRTYYINA